MIGILWIIGGIILVVLLLTGFRVVRPNERGLVEIFGKYSHLAQPGLSYIPPIGIGQMIKVDITENMVDLETPQEIITLDRLNAMVDAQVYFKVRNDETSIKNSQYNVYNYENQIVNLARTTLRNIIGTMNLNDANSGRNKINEQLMKTLAVETKSWGVEIVRAEIKEINPPQRVQDTMNEVVIAQNKKQSQLDYAIATETQADGLKKAKIKEAEGQMEYLKKIAEGEKQASILKAEGQQKAFELINKSFVGNAQLLRQLEVAENSLKDNVKFVVPQGSSLINVISDSAGVKVLPIKEIKPETKEVETAPEKKSSK